MRKSSLFLAISFILCICSTAYALEKQAKDLIYDIIPKKHTQKEIDTMVENISKIQNQSIKFFLNQEYISPMQNEIKEQSKLEEKEEFDVSRFEDFLLDFHFRYTNGLILAFQDLDARIEEYKKVYDEMLEFDKSKSVDPYRNIISKLDDGNWHANPDNPISFYFQSLNPYTEPYTIDSLYAYLQEYVSLVPIYTKGTLSKPSKTEQDVYNSNVKRLYDFLKRNNLNVYDYEPDKLAKCIIRQIMMLEAEKEDVMFKNVENAFESRFFLNSSICYELKAPIDMGTASLFIRTAVLSLTWKQYSEATKYVETNGVDFENFMDNIVARYAKQLKEKANKKI